MFISILKNKVHVCLMQRHLVKVLTSFPSLVYFKPQIQETWQWNVSECYPCHFHMLRLLLRAQVQSALSNGVCFWALEQKTYRTGFKSCFCSKEPNISWNDTPLNCKSMWGLLTEGSLQDAELPATFIIRIGAILQHFFRVHPQMPLNFYW